MSSRRQISGSFKVTDRKADVKKLLAPVQPTIILCIGLNYRHHAAESGLPAPENPVLFIKNPAAVQNPGDPILLPQKLKSDSVITNASWPSSLARPHATSPRPMR